MDNFNDLQTLKVQVMNFAPLCPDDVFVMEAVKEAVNAAGNGTFGIGAVLVDEKTNKIVCRGQNKVFTHHRSDFHAEMDVINVFETQNGSKSRELLRNLTLFTSLEPCPMCLCRIITSGITKVCYAADDDRGGMVHLYHQLPIVWQEISSNRVFKKADCSKELSEIAMRIFLVTSDLDNKLADS